MELNIIDYDPSLFESGHGDPPGDTGTFPDHEEDTELQIAEKEPDPNPGSDRIAELIKETEESVLDPDSRIKKEDLSDILAETDDENAGDKEDLNKINADDCAIVQNRDNSPQQRSDAIERLIRRNMKLCYTCINKYRNYYCSAYGEDDALSSAFQAIMRASFSFDPDKARFCTYTYIWICHYIQRDMLSFIPSVRFPIHDINLYYTLKHKYGDVDSNTFEEMLKKDEEVSAYTKTLLLKINRVFYMTSLDTPVSEEDDCTRTLGDTYASNDNVEETAISNLFNETISRMIDNKLDERQSWIIRYRYGIGGTGIGHTLEECGNNFPWGRLSRQRIKQLEKKALNTLMRWCKALGFKEDFLPIVAARLERDEGSGENAENSF